MKPMNRATVRSGCRTNMVRRPADPHPGPLSAAPVRGHDPTRGPIFGFYPAESGRKEPGCNGPKTPDTGARAGSALLAVVLAAGIIGALALMPLVPPVGMTQVDQERRAVADLARIVQGVSAYAVERGQLPRTLTEAGLTGKFLEPGPRDQHLLDPFSPGASEPYRLDVAGWSVTVKSQGVSPVAVPSRDVPLVDVADVAPLLAARTRRRLAIIHRVLERVLRVQSTLPEKDRGWAPAVRTALGLGPSFDCDAFNQPLLLQEEASSYRVVSVGPDGRPGTPDDLATPLVATAVETAGTTGTGRDTGTERGAGTERGTETKRDAGTAKKGR